MLEVSSTILTLDQKQKNKNKKRMMSKVDGQEVECNWREADMHHEKELIVV